tara:strand:+ start:59 stop:1459 length:1401 start_codon:yes stop_codon:yes gene_type:complete
MSIPRNLGNFADNVNANGKVEVTGINATGTPSGSTVLFGNGTWAAAGASAGGSTTQLQYNNAGAFAGSANMTFDGTSLTLPNDAFIGGYRVGAGVGGNNTVFTPTSASTIITGTAYQNVAFGVYALTSQTATGYTNNTALGWAAMRYNTTGVNNCAVGFSALNSNLSGSNSTAVGFEALKNSTDGNNTAVGFQAGTAISTGVQNTSIGRYSGASNNVSTGTANTSVGNYAGYNITSGNNNIAIGAEALLANTTGAGNTSVGHLSETAVTTGIQNTAVGRSTHSQLTTGNYNVCLGHGSGEAVATGTYCIAVGYGTAHSGSAVNYELVIGTNAQTGKGSSTGFISAASGSIYQGNNSTLWAVTSDQRLKKNIVDNNTGLEKITAIQVRNFEYRLPEEVTELPQNQAIQKTGVQLGVIAQELQAVLPECVKTESTGVMSVDADNLTWYMINAIKELKAEFDAYKALHP